MKCQICGNTEDNLIYEAKEQIYHPDESFSVFSANKLKTREIRNSNKND